MFKKVLIANRGEIAARIVRTCRDLGIQTVALYHSTDMSSLHVRLADECLPLTSNLGYLDQKAILRIVKESGADAIHPGYGFLAERADFIRACEKAGIAFIGPPSEVVEVLTDKIAVLNRVRAAGFPTPEYSSVAVGEGEIDVLSAEADRLGYPVIVKSCTGGRGRGSRWVSSPDRLDSARRRAQAEAHTIYRRRQVYVERAIVNARQIVVQVMGDQQGNLIHLGERDASLQYGNQKLIEESPAPGLTPTQRGRLWQMALDIARLFNYRNVGSVEFLMDEHGQFYFTEIKARIQMEHPVTEMVSQVDLVSAQIRIAANEPLTLKQENVQLRGWAMQCRINAEDPWRAYMPSPGHIQRLRLPAGPGVRVDTYAYSGCEVPARYDPVLAKVIVWGEDRDECARRMRRALEDFTAIGIPTNLPLHQRALSTPAFIQGEYTTDFFRHVIGGGPVSETYLRDLAVAAAIAYAQRNLAFHPSSPERVQSGWQRASRELPRW